MTGAPERSIRRMVADGRLDVIRRGRLIYLTPESVRILRDDLRARRFPVSELSERDRAYIREQVATIPKLSPEQLTALGTLLAEIRLQHAAKIAEEHAPP